MRGRLGTAIRARMLWHGGKPRCPGLAAEFNARSYGSKFSADHVRLVEKHIKSCESCAQEQRRATSPIALFAAAPMMAAPMTLRVSSAQALASEGVPIPESWEIPTQGGGADAVDLSDGQGSGAGGATVTGPGESYGMGATGGGAGGADAETAVAASTAEQTGAGAASGTRTLAWLFGTVGVLALILIALLVVWLLPSPSPLPLSSTAPAPQESVAPSDPPTGAQPIPPGAPPVAVGPPPGPGPTVTRTPVPQAPPPTEPEPATGLPDVELSAIPVSSDRCFGTLPFAYQVTWSTVRADQVVLITPGGKSDVDPSGDAIVCGGVAAEFTIIATGPEGETTRTVQAESSYDGI